MSDEVQALRQRILDADANGLDPFEDVIALMRLDRTFDIGIAALIRTTMDIIDHSQRRTATMSTPQYEAIAA